jgi:hypothetical protein
LGLDRRLLGRQLVGVHKLAAVMTNAPIIAITDDEGEKLGESLADIADYYGLTASRGAQLWISLAGTCAAVYGPKIFMMKIAKETAKAQRGQVVDIRPGQTRTAAPGPSAGGLPPVGTDVFNDTPGIMPEAKIEY